jgi:hypothetical protein
LQDSQAKPRKKPQVEGGKKQTPQQLAPSRLFLWLQVDLRAGTLQYQSAAPNLASEKCQLHLMMASSILHNLPVTMAWFRGP